MSRFVFLAILVLMSPLLAQKQKITTRIVQPPSNPSLTHTVGNQSYLITRVVSISDPLPLSDNYDIGILQEIASAKAHATEAKGSAKALDVAPPGFDASAEATDWNHAEWVVSAVGAPVPFLMNVSANLSAGGSVSIVNPPCSGSAACAHSVVVDLPLGSNEAEVRLAGDATSATGIVQWGTFTVNVNLPKTGSATWQVNPTSTVHTTGEYPIGGNGAQTPGPGNGLDQLSAQGFQDQCLVKIESGVNVRAYANGYYLSALAFDIGEAKSQVLTHMSLFVGGGEVDIPANF